jgi:hypothetical protein
MRWSATTRSVDSGQPDPAAQAHRQPGLLAGGHAPVLVRTVPRVPASSVGASQSVDDAIQMVMAGFGWLADADLAGVPASVRAECLRQLERARSV